MPEDKIQLALREIGYAPGLKVNIQDGVIVSILKQVILCEEKNGVKKQIVIDGEIVR